MSIPGWYPDPARAPGRFRFWDGTTWSADTTANPADPPPGGPGTAPRKRRRPGPIIAVAAALLIVALVAFFVLRPGPDTETADPLPSSAAPGGDDRSSPTSTSPTSPGPASPTPPDPPSASPTPVPSQLEPSPQPTQPCPVGDPDYRQSYPADGRQHGGNLSFPSQPGWRSPAPRGLTWAYDVGGQFINVEPQWFAMFAVAALSTTDGFETPEQSAEAAMECTASSDFYAGFVERRDLKAGAVTVDGHPGWRIRSEILVDSEVAKQPGDVVEIIVLDLDTPESLSMFWGAVPIGDRTLNAQLDQVVGRLTVG